LALEIIVAPLARRDLEDIFAYISAEDQVAALRVLERIEKTVDLLALRPFTGSRVLLPTDRPMRKMSVHPYIVFYRIEGSQLRIVRVIHTARDLNDPTLYRS
jgi:toxin ParE1/3/4